VSDKNDDLSLLVQFVTTMVGFTSLSQG